jgi:hypothetical protein
MGIGYTRIAEAWSTTTTARGGSWLMDESGRSGTTESSRKLGFSFELSIFADSFYFSARPDIGASWKIVRPLTGFSISILKFRKENNKQ